MIKEKKAQSATGFSPAKIRGLCRGQSAMEFLMTYGWAILVMVAVVSMLFYLGVLNPREQAPNVCTMPAGFSCYGYKISSGGELTLDLTQATGHTLTVTEIACDARETPSFSSVSEEISSGDHAQLTTTCYKISGAAPGAGEYYKGKIHIRYLDQNTGISHRIVGDITYRVESD